MKTKGSKKYLISAIGFLASLGMAILYGGSREKTKQAERDKQAQQDVTEAYRDSEEDFNKDVADGQRGDPLDHFK